MLVSTHTIKIRFRNLGCLTGSRNTGMNLKNGLKNATGD